LAFGRLCSGPEGQGANQFVEIIDISTYQHIADLPGVFRGHTVFPKDQHINITALDVAAPRTQAEVA